MRHCPYAHKEKRRNFHTKPTVHWQSTHGAGHIPLCGIFILKIIKGKPMVRYESITLISIIRLIRFNCHQISISAACVNYCSQRNRLNYQDLALNLVPEVLMTLIRRDAAPGMSLLRSTIQKIIQIKWYCPRWHLIYLDTMKKVKNKRKRFKLARQMFYIYKHNFD